MAQTITLAHLSDVHLGPLAGFSPPYWNLKRVLGYLNWRRGRVRVHLRSVADQIAADIRAQRPGHIAVTGDLANLGLPAEFRAARDWLERLGAPANVSVVPGNHDIYTGRMQGHSCLADWAAYMTNAPPDATVATGAGRFPYVRRVGPVALIGLNSAIPTPPFVAAGRVDDAQLQSLQHLLLDLGHEGLKRVVMIHHPPLPGQAPRRRALENAPALEAVLERCGAELVIHGHNHTQTRVWLASDDGNAIPVCGVASASAGLSHHGEPLAQYALYRFETGKQIERIMRGLRNPGGDIVELSRERMISPALLADEVDAHRG